MSSGRASRRALRKALIVGCRDGKAVVRDEGNGYEIGVM